MPGSSPQAALQAAQAVVTIPSRDGGVGGGGGGEIAGEERALGQGGGGVTVVVEGVLACLCHVQTPVTLRKAQGGGEGTNALRGTWVHEVKP